MHKINFKKGFSLVELMIVLVVIGILSTLALIGVGSLQAGARDTQRKQTITGLQTALERYFADKKYYPSTDWTTMLKALYTDGYISSYPHDPSAQSGKDLACSTGTATGGPVKDSAVFCGGSDGSGTKWVAGYSYTPSGSPVSSYQISLTMESGGSFNFNSPN